jgi:Tol biopolymer transport system component
MPAAPFEHPGLLYTPLRALVTALGGDITVAAGPPRVAVVHVPELRTPLRLTLGPTLQRLTESIPVKPAQYLLNMDGSGLTRLSSWLAPGSTVNAPELATQEFPDISPDGATLLYSRDGTLYRRQLNNPQEEVLLAADQTAGLLYSAPHYNRDGSAILCTLHRRNEEDTAYVVALNAHSKAITMLQPGWDPCFSPDGAKIALVERDDPYLRQTIVLVDLDGSHVQNITSGFAPCFNLDGSALLCSRWYAVDDEQHPGACGLVTHLLSGPMAGTEFEAPEDQRTTRELHGRFTPDGLQVLFDQTLLAHVGNQLWPGAGKGIFLMDRDRRNPVNLVPNGAIKPLMTPDEAQVLYLQDNSLYSWIRTTGEIRRLTSGLSIQHYALTPDGARIIFLAE